MPGIGQTTHAWLEITNGPKDYFGGGGGRQNFEMVANLHAEACGYEFPYAGYFSEAGLSLEPFPVEEPRQPPSWPTSAIGDGDVAEGSTAPPAPSPPPSPPQADPWSELDLTQGGTMSVPQPTSIRQPKPKYALGPVSSWPAYASHRTFEGLITALSDPPCGNESSVSQSPPCMVAVGTGCRKPGISSRTNESQE